MKPLIVTSSAFNNGSNIPRQYTCDGENVNPDLEIANIPPESRSVVLIMDDPDAPSGTFTHWIVANIPPRALVTIPEDAALDMPGVQGKNNFGKSQYGGPCPPSGTHRYYFKAYALNTELRIDEGADREEVESAMANHVIARGEIMGTYGR